MLIDMLKDSPAYEWMTEQTRMEEREKARQQVLEEREKALAQFRETVVAVVTQRFPGLLLLALKQVDAVDDMERLQQVIIRVSTTHNFIEVAKLLAALDAPGEKSAQA